MFDTYGVHGMQMLFQDIVALLSAISIGASTAVALLLMLLAYFYRWQLSRPALLTLLVIMPLLDLTLRILIMGSLGHNELFAILWTLNRGSLIGLLLQCWGLQFARMSAAKATVQVVRITLLAVALTLAAIALDPVIARLVSFTFLGVSSLSLALIYHPQHSDVTSKYPNAKNLGKLQTRRLRFFTTRLLYGFGIGFVLGLQYTASTVYAEHPLTRTLALLLAVGTLLGYGLMLVLRTRIHGLTVIPLFAITLLLIPHLNEGLPLIARVATVSSWLCFMILSSVQISSYKYTLLMGAAPLAFLEKTVVLIPWFLGNLLGVGISFSNLTAGNTQVTLGLIVMGFAYIIVIAAVFSLTRFAYNQSRFEQTGFSGTTQSGPNASDMHNTSAGVDRRNAYIVSLYALTPREGEVFMLLAAGRNRPYIQKTLGISEGTAKTHINHIHQKLGISSQQDLLDLVAQFSE
jgi:DNA-binding CsgD family transcriptional regulator